MSLDDLRKQYPWPESPPDVPEDWHGWLGRDTAQMLTEHLTEETQVVVECGSWLGLSARAILQHAPNATIICVDHWRGSPEHHRRPDWSCRLPALYETFLRNLWPWRERLVPLREDSLEGLAAIRRAEVAPNVIYIDSDHSYDHVSKELAYCTACWPTAVIVGDDYSWAGVRQAAEEHSRLSGRVLRIGGTSSYCFE